MEDNPETRMRVKHLLRNHYQAHVVDTMEEALQVAKSRRCDAVLLGVSLGEPEAGFDVLRKLRRLPGYAAVPFVAMTAPALPGDRERMPSENFDDVLARPFSRSQLLQLVERLLRADRQGGRFGRGPSQ